MSHRKDKPDEVDIALVRLVGLGYTSLEAGKKLGLVRWATRSRIVRLKHLTGTSTQAHLVWWMLNEYLMWYDPRRRFESKKPDQLKLDLIQMVAQGHSQEEICQKLYLTPGGYDRRIRDARRMTNTKSTAHLVAICWTKDWII